MSTFSYLSFVFEVLFFPPKWTLTKEPSLLAWSAFLQCRPSSKFSIVGQTQIGKPVELDIACLDVRLESRWLLPKASMFNRTTFNFSKRNLSPVYLVSTSLSRDWQSQCAWLYARMGRIWRCPSLTPCVYTYVSRLWCYLSLFLSFCLFPYLFSFLYAKQYS